jgi:hypothetical protein
MELFHTELIFLLKDRLGEVKDMLLLPGKCLFAS